ncbi:MAG: hypothetical protein GY851_16410 [bacterium]|nr:hypothetical protein [bacterium]
MPYVVGRPYAERGAPMLEAGQTMVQQSEVITLIACLGGLVFIAANYSAIRRIPHARILLFGFLATLGTSVFTVLEGFVWPNALNLAEHTCCTVASIFLAAWIWHTLHGKESAQ